MRRWLERVALVVGSVVCFLLVSEVVARVAADDVELLTFRNFARQRLSLFASAYPSEYHATLGWVPKRGYAGESDNIWKTHVTIDERGFRNNGGPRVEGPTVVTVGDSFVFGDEVNDDDTLAARLEAQLGRPVINAGVFGYGLDQSVLRAELILDDLNPEVVVLQAVRDDIVRMQMSVRTGVNKPYFELTDDTLTLKNVPTPPERPSIADIGALRAVLGYSYLLDWTMRATGRGATWYVGHWKDAYVHHDLPLATETACRLVRRLGSTLRERHIKGIFVAEYAHHVLQLSAPDDPWIAPLVEVVRCAREAGFAIADTYVSMRPIANDDPTRYRNFYREVHLSRAGNAFVAAQIADLLND